MCRALMMHSIFEGRYFGLFLVSKEAHLLPGMLQPRAKITFHLVDSPDMSVEKGAHCHIPKMISKKISISLLSW
jgi:hypothetical protein